MDCPGCIRKDCTSCANCKDMVKFGGKGRKKQRCIYRVCTQKVASKKGTSQRGKDFFLIKGEGFTVHYVDVYCTLYRLSRIHTNTLEPTPTLDTTPELYTTTEILLNRPLAYEHRGI